MPFCRLTERNLGLGMTFKDLCKSLSMKPLDSEGSLRSLLSKNFLQSSLPCFCESFGSELSSRGHPSAFSNRIVDFSKESVGRSL